VVFSCIFTRFSVSLGNVAVYIVDLRHLVFFVWGRCPAFEIHFSTTDNLLLVI